MVTPKMIRNGSTFVWNVGMLELAVMVAMVTLHILLLNYHYLGHFLMIRDNITRSIPK